MRSHSGSRAATGTSDESLTSLAAAFRQALALPDVRSGRAMVAEAAHAGIPVGRLYVEVVRPALAELQRPRLSASERLAVGLGESILADLLATLPPVDRRSVGRAAVLSCRQSGIEAVDGTVAMDFLESDGWKVERLLGSEGDGSDLPRDGTIELAVAVTAGPEDALRLAPVCTDLRRLADPPVMLVCDFSGRQASRRRAVAASLGADAVVYDPLELIQSAAKRLPRGGQRRWGVRLSRTEDGLLLAPTGRLDAVSVGRLTDVVLTRLGTFSRLEVDLRDLAEVMPSGVDELARWPQLLALDDVAVEFLATAQVHRDLGARTSPFPFAVSGLGAA